MTSSQRPSVSGRMFGNWAILNVNTSLKIIAYDYREFYIFLLNFIIFFFMYGIYFFSDGDRKETSSHRVAVLQ